MNISEILILAIALAIDAMLVSFSYGLIIKEKRIKNALKLSFSFGFFQFLMPFTGWHFTGFIYNYVEAYSKIIVFAVFMWLGIKFLKDAFSKEEKTTGECCISLWCIIYLSFATSIDAFSAGISLRLMNAGILSFSLLTGIITFILSCFGFFSAKIFFCFPSKFVNIAGAMLLIYLAIQALI